TRERRRTGGRRYGRPRDDAGGAPVRDLRRRRQGRRVRRDGVRAARARHHFGPLQLAIWKKQFTDYRHTLADLIKLDAGITVQPNVFKASYTEGDTFPAWLRSIEPHVRSSAWRPSTRAVGPGTRQTWSQTRSRSWISARARPSSTSEPGRGSSRGCCSTRSWP